MTKKFSLLSASVMAVAAILASAPIGAEEVKPDVAVEYVEGGRAFTKDDIPTYFIAEDGTVDWPVFSGFRRYHAECHVCHGPDGEGSTYAPALKESALAMDYYDFIEVIASGRQKVGASENSVMPAFGTNKNVMCFVDDIYVYLKARGMDAIARGRPAKKVDKPDELRAEEEECMSG
ncbi:c-type cytochrome, methanol metabolism-related [Polymorphum gilvum]|uniref:Cytochrome c553I n=1 Tax=Polymorphum gilvum (strain LMG 25793 / CGMCC 1.9160 / SL003B-26A1) TaxID=991905 RepID=F2IXW5_POLGS|nr:c-type cytochrome, methanol metabolism-related [Polymorphum gilvum]ADZ69446.1 Cytochrome c553I [Polymorphum gilvum SL003B-26A1]